MSLGVPDEISETRLSAFLNRLAGPGAGQAFLDRILKSDEPTWKIARDLAVSLPFERLYKEAKTLDTRMAEKEADFELVGIKNFDRSASFSDQFEIHFLPRLASRSEGFRVLFNELLGLKRKLFIVETGCMRIPGNWEGDGQSTLLFDTLLEETGGAFLSIDANIESVETARRACSSRTQLMLSDSVVALNAIAQISSNRLDLLYLDSFDLDQGAPMPSAVHHAMEFMAARSLVGPGTMVCVDDYDTGQGSVGGKALILDQFFSRISAEVVFAGYQKIWRLL